MDARFHRFDVAANPLADLVFFSRNTLPVRQQRFVLAKVDRDIRPLKAPDCPANDVSHPVLKLGKDQLLLSPPDVLHERLFGVLRGNSAEIRRSHFDFNFISQNRIRLDPASIKNRNLVMLRKHLLGYLKLCISADIATLLIDLAAQLARRSDRLFGR